MLGETLLVRPVQWDDAQLALRPSALHLRLLLTRFVNPVFTLEKIKIKLWIIGNLGHVYRYPTFSYENISREIC